MRERGERRRVSTSPLPRGAGCRRDEVEKRRCLSLSLTHTFFSLSSNCFLRGGGTLSPRLVSLLSFSFPEQPCSLDSSSPLRAIKSCRRLAKQGGKRPEKRKNRAFIQCRLLLLLRRGPAARPRLLLPPRSRRPRTARRSCRVSGSFVCSCPGMEENESERHCALF